MTIERIGQVDPLQNSKKNQRSQESGGVKGSDSIALSKEAREMGEVYQAIEIAKNAPDVRLDKIALLKAKINDPEYFSDSVISLTADKIIDQLYS